ncbi:hypothetical protein D9756_003992 [Leucocoprinus leucothites]|uniref:CS domain-containing protein n=1 Tax=Leucocoprinus leucothites TaxID=201217 RepID=A0A8H5FZV7_9AGAR|nr:hypothetical protein D9756_003992 [Leucoagaricus leucothites]
MTIHPEILWAQRSSEVDEAKNVIYLTVNLPDIHEATMKYTLTENALNFKAVAGADKEHEKEYEFDLAFFDEIKSSKKFNSRALDLRLQKKNNKAEYWPSLTKQKNRFVKTNFERWVDEDEQDGEPENDLDFEGMGGGMGGGMGAGGGPGMGDMDIQRMMAQMQASGGGMGGPSHAQGDDDDESDDEGPPPLEDAEPTT